MALLAIDDLKVDLDLAEGYRPVLCGVTLQIEEGESVALVGESGSGKTMTALSVIRLLPPRARASGSISFADTEVLPMTEAALEEYRTRDIAMVFQDSRAHVNPIRTIGDYMTEVLTTNLGVGGVDASARAEKALEEVKVPEPRKRLAQYPHELSGGLMQRVMIAASLLTEPRLLIADEPTTALDVTTQAEVMAIFNELRARHGLSMLFITHDLELAEAACDRTVVMYAGRVMEDRESTLLHGDPLHPYSAALARSRPSLTEPVGRLATIPGSPASALDGLEGCPFAPRCAHVEEECLAWDPITAALAGGRVTCRRASELRGELTA